jgi:hypothetical protein
MPRVEVLTELPGSGHQVMLTERVPAEMFADEHYADQLIERMGWALLDAEEYEQRSTPDCIVGPASAGQGG